MDQYTHLGIATDGNLSAKHFVQKACHKLRGIYLSIINSGLHPKRLSPLTLKTIYSSVVIPGALYGCETIVNLSTNDMNMLERAHKFCVKNMQGFGKYISTDFVLSTINVDSIEDAIEYRKLTIIGQLCRLSPKYLAKKFLNVRLIQYFNRTERALGFIPHKMCIMNKYGLTTFISDYLNTGKFPSRMHWKNIIHHAVIVQHRKERYERLLAHHHHFSENIVQFNSVSDLWLLYRDSIELRPFIQCLMNLTGLLFSRRYVQSCCLCTLLCEDIVTHVMFECTASFSKRHCLNRYVWSSTTTAQFVNLTKNSFEAQCEQIVSMAINEILSKEPGLSKILLSMFKPLFC